MIRVAEGFAPRMKAFTSQWAALWSLAPEGRADIAQRVIELRHAKRTRQHELQREIVEAAVAAPRGPAEGAALGILDYVAHLWGQSDESEEEMLSEYQRLGFLEGAGSEGPDFVRDFFGRLQSEGFERGHAEDPA